MAFQTFESWAQLLDHVAAGYPLFYHAPMDINPAQVSAVLRRDGKLRVTPIYASADPFTADAGHLDRFRRQPKNERPNIRRYPHPGKFEGGLLIDEFMWNMALDASDDETGDVDGGQHFARLNAPLSPTPDYMNGEELTEDEHTFILKQAGAIVRTDSQGFVSVTYYATTAELDTAWDDAVEATTEDDIDVDAVEDEE
jgi:hypothetical protein